MTGYVSSVPARVLTLLDAADRPEVLDLPGMAFHPLKGDLKGFYAVTVRANWRVIDRFENGNAYDVSLIDYRSRKETEPCP